MIRSMAIAAGLLVATGAQAQTYNFEGETTGLRTSTTETVGGVTLTLTRQGGASYDINDGASAAPSFGNLSISPFNDTSANAFIADFSTGLSDISISYGDYNADSDTFTMSIFSGANGTGTNLGTVTYNYGLADISNGDSAVATSSLSSATPFLSAVFIGGSAGFPNSLYYDNIVVHTAGAASVPEPTTWSMMLIGFGAIAFAARRRVGGSKSEGAVA